MAVPAKLTIAPRFLALVALPMLVVIVSEGLLSAFGNPQALADIQLSEARELPELIARYRFLAVFLFYVAVTVTVIAIFVAELQSRHSRRSILATVATLVGLVVFSFLFSMWEPSWMGSFEAYELLGARLFEEGLAVGNMPACGADRCDGQGAFQVLGVLTDVTNILSALAVSVVILGMILALARSGPVDLDSADGIKREAAALAGAQKAVRRYLYLAGVLLSVGMIMGLTWMHWPADMIADPGQARGYGDLVQSISLYRGVSYTVLILSFYMPVSLIQMVRVERLYEAAEDQEIPDVAAQVQSFDVERIGSLDAFKAILSILYPILAAAAGSFTGINPFGL